MSNRLSPPCTTLETREPVSLPCVQLISRSEMATLLARLSWSVETDGTPLGFGEMEVWGDSIPRVLRTLGCMTQARWAWFMESVSLIDLRSEQHFSE